MKSQHEHDVPPEAVPDIPEAPVRRRSTQPGPIALEACYAPHTGPQGAAIADALRLLAVWAVRAARRGQQGATGAAQVYEVAKQFRGECGERQVEGAKIAMTDTLGADLCMVCNMIFRI